MYRILVVDDEKKHRSGLLKLLYSLYPEEVILEADSGEQALEVMQLIKCDIVITDISMPGIDGIELSSRLRDLYPESKIIILSGYGEFHYAREAIRCGVVEYLLKPVSREEVEECINNVMEDIEKQRIKEQKQLEIREQLSESEIIYMDYLMKQFISNESYIKKERIKEVFPIESPGLVFLCERQNTNNAVAETTELKLIIKTTFSGYSVYTFQMEENGFYVVIVLGEKKPLLSLFEVLDQRMKVSFPQNRYFYYISQFHENMYLEGYTAFHEAMKVREYNFYELGQFCTYEVLKNRISNHVPVSLFCSEEIVDKIKKNEAMGAYQQIKKDVTPGEELPQPRELCRIVMLLFYQVIRGIDTLIGDEMKQKTDQYLKEIYEAETMGMLLRLTYRFLVEIGKDVHYQKETKGTDVMEHCRDYLDKHYMDEITLEAVAEKYYFHPSYFSTSFKNYFGKSFSVYIMELRMKKAKELLIYSDAKIKEITNQVGYRDPNYFIRAFKKYYGYTPEEYRKIKAQD